MTNHIPVLLKAALRGGLLTLFTMLQLSTNVDVAAQCNSPVFSGAPSYAANRTPDSVAVGEFNGDGKLDLAVSNLGSDNVSILLGDGFGGFGPPSNFPVNHQPSAIASGDFNKDGRADLAVAHSFGGPVSVLFGTGNGTFSAPTNVGSTSNPNGLAVADFNADGNPDIAASSLGSQLILLGNGSGSFASNNVSVGSGASSVTAADFNGDGVDDAAFTADGAGNWKVALVFGNAAGAFSVNSTFPVSQAPEAIAVGNFNADLQPDLIVVGVWSEPRVSLFINQGGGTFTMSTEFFAGRGPRAVTVGDFNNDGKLDAAVALAEANNVLITLGDGLGHLSTPTYYGTGVTPVSVASGDFNADGKLDLVTADASSSIFAANPTGSVSTLLGTGTGAFQTYRSYTYPYTAQFVLQPTAIAVGDFNNNNRPDLALSFIFTPYIAIMLDDGLGGLVQPTGFYDAGNRPVSLAISDLNGDNNADFITANSNGGNISIFFGHGNGSFMPRVQVSVNPSPKFVGVGDFNGDGKRDLIVTHEAPANAVIMLGDGIGGFAQPGGPLPPVVQDIAVGDFNGDGKSDVVAGNFPQNNVSIFLGDATGHLNLASTTSSSGVNTTMRIQVADLNADNHLDVVLANIESNNISVYLGDGMGGLLAGTNFAAGPIPFDLAIADFDDDGKSDVAVANNGAQSISLYPGNGTGGLKAPVPYPVGPNPNGLANADFNQDSKPDLAVLSGTSSSVSILKNVLTQLPCLSVNDVTVTEGDVGTVNADFNVTLSQPSLQAVRVNYSLVDQTATNGPDYSPLSGRLVFAPGETTKTISVSVLGDTIDEIDETLRLQLASPFGAAISDDIGQVTILDNDPIPSISINDISNVEASLLRNFTVTLSSVSGREITVQFATADGTAIAGTQTAAGDYSSRSGTLTIPAGQTSAQVSISVFGDVTFEPDETFFLNLSNPTNATLIDSQGQATIVNDDPIPGVEVSVGIVEEGNVGTREASFFVNLSNPTTQSVTLNFATSNGTATAGSDYIATSGSLTFAPGEVQKLIIVLINGDTDDETGETFFVDLTSVQNATLTTSRATGFINDDDGPTISINDISIVEGNAGTSLVGFTLTLSAPSVETVAVRATAAPGTATAVSDYVPFNSTLVIPAGTLTRTFNISVVGDTSVEPDETFFVNLSNPERATIADSQGRITILDDDGLRLVLEESGPDANQAAAIDAILFVRDPFRVRRVLDWLTLGPDRNTRVIIFAANLQINQGEPASAVTVSLVGSSNQSYELPAEDVRAVPGFDFTQVTFRLPDSLSPGVCNVTINAHGQRSNSGTIRGVP